MAQRKNLTMRAYKIFRAPEYEQLLRDGESAGSPVDLADGYIHLSTASQLAGTLTKHFAGETGLRLLAVETELLAPLKWEPSRGGDLFPHLYRVLRVADIVWTRDIGIGPDGHITGELE
ncbi:DUF952 domain-containing protein [Paracoccus sp. MBLB3053]|uniref:DUF952 domain-containing protein n=1 Tax=Paracoccus aurantius TaxID=3073814 RepID=A0ABU2HMM3_9RHOB|nr:DUF952 domain-containing protein [Paracoccus sp. MBLB3053]MDS9466007.1 DUF952 domain-containing protein [Paracoccus sp. MBLB3053]